MSLSILIKSINKNLQQLFDKYPGSKIYELAKTTERKQGTVNESFPTVLDINGELLYIGVDDISPVILYHKTTGFSVAYKDANGFGDENSMIAYTYNNQMVIFLDTKKTSLLPDDFIRLIQANFPDRFKLSPYRLITAKIQNANLNSSQVFKTEYPNQEEKLKPEQNMMAISYQLEANFHKSCLKKCP